MIAVGKSAGLYLPGVMPIIVCTLEKLTLQVIELDPGQWDSR